MVQDPFAIAVKAFIVKGDTVLLIKRPEEAPHKSGVWEIPGGRLAQGENPFKGLKREVSEEVGLNVEILNPLKIHHFVRDDGQKITMIVFACKPVSEEVKLSHEHTHYDWVKLDKAHEIIVPDFAEDVAFYQKTFQK